MFLHEEEMTRLAEVELYAEKRRISVHDAIIELVNKGLSHWEFRGDHG